MIKNLQALRFIFILLIVISHLPKESFSFGGEGGVAFFFMLSGFVLSYAYGNRILERQFDRKKFFLKQLCKLYPLHLLTFVLLVILNARIGHCYHWTKLLANALLLQSWIPSNEFYFVANGASWFLSDILFFYIMFPIIFPFLFKSSRGTLAVTGTIILVLYGWLASSIPYDMINPLLYASPLTRLIDFSIGILTYRLFSSQVSALLRQRLNQRSTVFITAIEIAMVFLQVGTFFIYENASWRFTCACLFWFTQPIILYVYAMTDQQQGIFSKFMHLPFMQWLGSISFEIYLTHALVVRFFYNIMTSGGVRVESLQSLGGEASLFITMILTGYITKRFFVDPVYSRFTKIM